MIGSIRFLLLVAAGLVALLSAPGPAAAHDPPAAPREAQPARLAPTTGEPDPRASSGVRSLRELAAGGQATLVVRVLRTDSFDDGKLLVYRLAVERTLRGGPAGSAASVIDVRAGLTRPPLLAEGQRAVVTVTPAPSLSYVAQQLPGETGLLQLAGGRDGVVPVASEGDVDEVAALLDAAERVDEAPDGPERQTALRALAFRLLAADQPRLAADGLLELRRLAGPIELTTDEITTLARVLRTTTIPAPTRIGLIRLLGQRRWGGALAALDGVAADQPDVLAALLGARADLGAPATRADLTPYLGSKDPAVQAAAVAALARIGDAGAIDELGRWAVADGDRGVRESAIVALGQSKRPEASRYLQQTFASPDRFLMQASARALLDLEEADGNAAFVELALRGQSSDVRRYAALLLVTTRGREHPAVQQLLTRNPDPEVRHVIEHGIELHDVHRHE